MRVIYICMHSCRDMFKGRYAYLLEFRKFHSWSELNKDAPKFHIKPNEVLISCAPAILNNELHMYKYTHTHTDVWMSTHKYIKYIFLLLSCSAIDAHAWHATAMCVGRIKLSACVYVAQQCVVNNSSEVAISYLMDSRAIFVADLCCTQHYLHLHGMRTYAHMNKMQAFRKLIFVSAEFHISL